MHVVCKICYLTCARVYKCMSISVSIYLSIYNIYVDIYLYIYIYIYILHRICKVHIRTTSDFGGGGGVRPNTRQTSAQNSREGGGVCFLGLSSDPIPTFPLPYPKANLSLHWCRN
jgi:hypothetical protein